MSINPIVYVGTVGEGIWRSNDGGIEWSRTSQGMFMECDVRALAVHPDNSKTLYAGTNEGCYFSDDGGDNWTKLDSPMNSGELYRSRDGGGRWEKLPREFGEIRSLSWVPG